MDEGPEVGNWLGRSRSQGSNSFSAWLHMAESTKKKECKFSLSEDGETLAWSGANEKSEWMSFWFSPWRGVGDKLESDLIFMRDVTSLVEGKTTPVFRRSGCARIDPNCCFSVVTHYRTINLEFRSREELREVVHGVSSLLTHMWETTKQTPGLSIQTPSPVIEFHQNAQVVSGLSNVSSLDTSAPGSISSNGRQPCAPPFSPNDESRPNVSTTSAPSIPQDLLEQTVNGGQAGEDAGVELGQVEVETLLNNNGDDDDDGDDAVSCRRPVRTSCGRPRGETPPSSDCGRSQAPRSTDDTILNVHNNDDTTGSQAQQQQQADLEPSCAPTRRTSTGGEGGGGSVSVGTLRRLDGGSSGNEGGSGSGRRLLVSGGGGGAIGRPASEVLRHSTPSPSLSASYHSPLLSPRASGGVGGGGSLPPDPCYDPSPPPIPADVDVPPFPEWNWGRGWWFAVGGGGGAGNGGGGG